MTAAPTTGEPIAGEPTVQRIDPAGITVTASSALAPVGDLRYDPEVVLDGDPATAWNDGVDGALGIGEQLTFRFDAPVDLVSLEVVNGYDRIDPDSGEDRWAQNGRVDELGIATDAGSATVRLADTREPQAVEPPAGTTCVVALTVESVHDGDQYLDVAISEVAFDGRPADGTCAD